MSSGNQDVIKKANRSWQKLLDEIKAPADDVSPRLSALVIHEIARTDPPRMEVILTLCSISLAVLLYVRGAARKETELLDPPGSRSHASPSGTHPCPSIY